MPRLIWTPQALGDVQRIYRFLLPKNADAARRAVQALRVGVKVLSQQPHLGRLAEAMEPEFREWPIKFGDSGYVALYRVDADIVAVLAVRHQKEAGYS